MSHTVLTIVGPTAVGKTAFAWQVADALLAEGRHQGVDFFSADSRQIYQGLEIISGADLPAEGAFHPASDVPGAGMLDQYWQSLDGRVRIFGVASLQPDQDWSVAHFQRLIQEVLPNSWAADRLPVIVGGTGLYVGHSLASDSRLHVPPNQEIRQKVEALPLSEIQDWAQQVAPEKYASLNDSDRQNPRRLVRVLEIALYQPPIVKSSVLHDFSRVKTLTIGLQDTLEHIEQRIAQRVEVRWQMGAPAEVETLIARFPDQKLPIFSATGVKPILAYLSDRASAPAAQAKWTTQERQYAKRQATWWKKQAQVEWFDIQATNWQTKALTTIKDWLAQ